MDEKRASKMISKKRNFSRIDDIFFFFIKTSFFQRDLKKTNFSTNFDISGDRGKKRFFQSEPKKLPLLRNVDIYVDIYCSDLKITTFS